LAIIRITQPPITREIYDAVNAKLGADNPAEGLLMHSAGEVNGTWQIVDVWESEEHYRRFDSERLTPAIQEVAGQAPPGAAPSVTVYEAYNVIFP
jgi:hypothetical protein